MLTFISAALRSSLLFFFFFFFAYVHRPVRNQEYFFDGEKFSGGKSIPCLVKQWLLIVLAELLFGKALRVSYTKFSLLREYSISEMIK